MDAYAMPADRRRHRRSPLPAAYTAVSVRRAGRRTFNLRGHAYDLSAGGARIELDQPLRAGEQVDVRLEIPGQTPRRLQATGRIVHLEATDQPGPAVMGVAFTDAVQF